ncbi:MAG: 7,8-didemethyl-8-hydroxy-5-deazariboflavin synthase subunit CofH [Actinobacteria bacterium RBG_16_68_21]|nr:MAG: 7,8-didemethyl-8-hydroxy-5-deazariboflavin synthase subunit CofH [Actinobacteria bacterium RBG_16_68_21]
MITFLALRPADGVTEVWAATRRREGTTTVEIAGITTADVVGAIAGGLLPVSSGPGEGGAAAWVAEPAVVLGLAERGIPGWRLTVIDDGEEESVLDAAARSRASHVRTGRSRVAAMAELVSIPGLETVVSVFVDSVEDAVAAVAAGAGDLLLRDWDTERIGQLRDALGGALVERTAFPIGLAADVARAGLPPEVFAAWLHLVDGSGAARPRYSWAPGKDEPVPASATRFSAEWGDPPWATRSDPSGLDHLDPALRGILERSLGGSPPSRDEVERLFRSRGDEVDAVARVADDLRLRANGDTVTYVVNRNINYTNQCYFRCGFCAFSKGPRSLSLRGDPYLLEIHEVVFRTVEAWERGATEVCLQGGIHPDFTGEFYVAVLKAIKEAVPAIHVHGFTPLEVWQGAETLGTSVADFLGRLKEAGLGTLPGTAAEILDDDIRRHLCPDKITTAEWARVMVLAHEMGLRSTATMMFGHIDGPPSWANHFEVLRAIQRRTGGFTEFVPLPFVHMGAPIFLRGRARPGPTWDEVVLVHAVARIAFDGLIPNIQASWVKLGIPGAASLLRAGCNDLGGTLIDENISHAAGASHGRGITPEELDAAIVAAGRSPMRRSTLYGALQRAD